MPAKGNSTATLHGSVGLQLLIVENSLEALQKLLALATDDVSHFMRLSRVMNADGVETTALSNA